jgi:hypothetical protein
MPLHRPLRVTVQARSALKGCFLHRTPLILSRRVACNSVHREVTASAETHYPIAPTAVSSLLLHLLHHSEQADLSSLKHQRPFIASK